MKKLIKLGSIALAVGLVVALVLTLMPTSVGTSLRGFLPSNVTRDGFLSLSSNVALAVGGDSEEVGQETLPGDEVMSNRTHYTDGQGVSQYIDNSWTSSTLPWSYEMTHADYNVKVKEDITAGQVIEFSRDGGSITLQPMALQWTNDLGQIQEISMPQSVSPIVGTKEKDLVPEVTNNEGYIQWDNAYGNGIDLQWQCTPGTLEKRLVIDSLGNLPLPEKYILDGKNPVLELNLIFDHSKGIDIYVDGDKWNESSKVQTFDFIQFTRGGETVWSFKPLRYWCSDNGLMDGESVATLDKKGNPLYISVRVPYEWLQKAEYPVFVDADIAIETSLISLQHTAERAGPFWTSPTVGYVIFTASAAGTDLEYRKTTNGGANWGAGVVIVNGASIITYDCWADWQTGGNDGTKIHMAYADSGTDDVRYVYLDTDGDSVGGDDQIEASQGDGTLYSTIGKLSHQVSITKTRGGNLTVALRYRDNSSAYFYEFYTSPDATTWTEEASPWEAMNDDRILLFPGNEADSQDVWAVFGDDSSSELSLKTYDDSGDSWGEQLISSGINVSDGWQFMDGSVRLSDGHLILAAWEDILVNTADLKIWDINGSGSITAKTNATNHDDTNYTLAVSMFINQSNDDLYVSYARGAFWTVKVYYQKSANGGTSWGGETAMQANTGDDERWISCGAAKAAWGGKFQPVWYNDDLKDLFTNVDSGISIAAVVPGDISNAPDSKAFGTLELSSSAWSDGAAPEWPLDDTECYFEVTNNGDACSITLEATNFTGTGTDWTLGVPDANVARLKAGKSGDALEANMVTLTNSPQSFITGLAGSGTKKWEIKLDMPTSADKYEKTSTLTLIATLD